MESRQLGPKKWILFAALIVFAGLLYASIFIKVTLYGP